MSDKFNLPCSVETDLDDSKNIWLTDKTHVRACFFNEGLAEHAANSINTVTEKEKEISELKRKVFSLNAIKTGMSKEQFSSDKRAEKQVKRLLDALDSVTGHYDASEIAHFFGLDAGSAERVVEAINSAEVFLGGGKG